LPGRGHGVRHPLGDPRGDQRDRDRLRPQPQRLERRRPGLDAVHARDVAGLRDRRLGRRHRRSARSGRRDPLRGPLPGRRRLPRRSARCDLGLQPRRLVRPSGGRAVVVAAGPVRRRRL
ncbi:MAG: GH23 / GH103, partial [uncultured Thermoleophilia bacterium]